MPAAWRATASAARSEASAAASARRPTRPIFRLERARLETKVHQRVNVRVLELIDRETGARIELEGNRIPTLHTGPVLDALKD